MKNISLIASLSLALMPLGCNVSKAPPASPRITHPTSQPHPGIPEGDTTDRTFDFYLLNLSWSPEFCHSHPNASECAQRSTLVLHGLWPQNNTGPYIQNCSTDPGPRNPAAYSDIYPDPGLLRHEWRTHGTCSGLSADDFFNLARKAFHSSVAIPPTLAQLDHQISLPPTQLITLFQQANPNIPAASLAISCGNNYLTAVEVCLDKRAQPIPCGNIRSCRANTVRITPP
jgi:ribonuclease T2